MSQELPLSRDRFSSIPISTAPSHGDSTNEHSTIDPVAQGSVSSMALGSQNALTIHKGQNAWLSSYERLPHEPHNFQRLENYGTDDGHDVTVSGNFSEGDDVLSDIEDTKNQRVEKLTYQKYSARGRTQRFRLTHSQTRFLMSEFARQPHPDSVERQRMSKEIPGLSPRQVQIWFQNRRAKLKRLNAEDRNQMIRSRMLPEDFQTSQALRTSFDRGSSIPESGYARADSVSYTSQQTGDIKAFQNSMALETLRRLFADRHVASPLETTPQSSTSYQSSTFSSSFGYGRQNSNHYIMRGIVGDVNPSNQSENWRDGSFSAVMTPQTPQSLTGSLGFSERRIGNQDLSLRSEIVFPTTFEPAMATRPSMPSRSQSFQTTGSSKTAGFQLLREPESLSRQHDDKPLGQLSHRTQSYNESLPNENEQIMHSHSHSYSSEAFLPLIKPPRSPLRLIQSSTDSQPPRLSLEIPHPYIQSEVGNITTIGAHTQSDQIFSAPAITMYNDSHLYNSNAAQRVNQDAQNFQEWNDARNRHISGSRSSSSSTQVPYANEEYRSYKHN